MVTIEYCTSIKWGIRVCCHKNNVTLEEAYNRCCTFDNVDNFVYLIDNCPDELKYDEIVEMYDDIINTINRRIDRINNNNIDDKIDKLNYLNRAKNLLNSSLNKV